MGMKKDKFIQQKLNEYADGLKLNPSLIDDALAEVRRNRARAAVRPSRKGLYALGAVAIAAVFLVLAVNIFSTLLKNIGGQNKAQYGLSDLTIRRIELSEIPEIDENIPYLNLELMNSECTLLLDKESEEAVMVYTKYKVLGEGGTSEIVFIADLKRGFKELTDFKRLAGKEIGGLQIRYRHFYEDGEYHTNAYYTKEGIDYYFISMSPWPEGGDYYLEILLGF